MHLHRLKNPNNCCGCGACAAACNMKCIAMIQDTEGFLYPLTDENCCIECGACKKVCPMLLIPHQGQPPAAFAAWNRDAAVRAESSSGGIFSALMQRTLQQGGIVIGAAFDSTMTLRHQSAQDEAESHKFRGSKYLQSIIGDVYREVQEHLKQNRHVLFSGTPCQIAGLYTFLGSDHNKLLTCDLVCHGVPSPKVFTAYKENLERRHNAKVRKIDFRSKDSGWKRFSVSLSFDNDTEYRRVVTDDPFMFGYLRDTYLRPSCHTCRFSRIPRVADITLGDFWGVGDHHPEWDDDRGTSLILVQTAKGLDAFAAIRDALVVHDADLDLAIRSNPCICTSVSPKPNRAAFFCDLERIPFERVIKKYMSPPTLWYRLFFLLKRVTRRLILRNLEQ